MEVDGKKPRHGQLNTMDRLSDLPDSILHHIISFLHTEEACRTTILSKRWVHIWSTGLILDFRPMFFVPKIDGEFVDGYVRSILGPFYTGTIERFVNFIESTMRRYSEKNLSIKRFRLECPTHPQMAERIDGWLEIVSRNQVEALSLSIISEGSPPSYGLPAIFFLAKSLIWVTFCRVSVPYFENLKLISLQSLVMTFVHVDENMLQYIITSCPLKILKLDRCAGFQNISIPCSSRLESLHIIGTVPVGGTILVDTSSFHFCIYHGGRKVDPFPIILTPASKRNLRVLHIVNARIIDEFFGKLVSELPSIESLGFFNCTMPINVEIASQTLKKLAISNGYNMINLVIEAPNLEDFKYKGDLQHSSVIISRNKYNAYLHLSFLKLDTRALVAIKNLLSKSNCCCKDLSIFLRGDAPEIEFDKDQLNKIDDGSPCDVEELKLCVKWSSSFLGESSCRALIDSLLWCCRPDILSLLVNLNFDNTVIQLLRLLDHKGALRHAILQFPYWKHPLKRMEII